MNEVRVNDGVWMLHCKNEKCNEFFDYFGPVTAFTNISCTHCGKVCQAWRCGFQEARRRRVTRAMGYVLSQRRQCLNV